jgi:hypothetical protein
MTYELHRLDDALVVRWIATPTRATATALGAELDTALRAARSPLALWIVIDTDRADPPAPDARKVLQETARSLFDLSRSVDLVILGEGLRASLMRTFLRTMALVTRTRDRMHVHEGIDQAARRRSLDARLLATLRGSA